jgi:hypothetical protein
MELPSEIWRGGYPNRTTKSIAYNLQTILSFE